VVSPRESGGRRLGRRFARRDESVETREQTFALRAPRWIREPVRRDERCDGQRLRITQCEIRQARQARLEPVDDVEAAERERHREVCTRTHRHADSAPPRDRHRRPERNEVGIEPVEQRATPRSEVAGAVRGCEDRDRVAQRPQLAGHALDVLVDVVRLRPGERRHEADPKGHSLRV
jgi:hypothetical protein